MRTLVVSLLLVLLALPAFAVGFPVLQGNQQAVVVYENTAKAETQKAYQDLVFYLKQATGKDFRAVSEAEYELMAGGLPIYVGRCGAVKAALHRDLISLDRDAYIVSVQPRGAMLVGRSPWSTYWAVCQFLEDVVGVRWLIPGPLGEDVPRQSEIVAPLGTKTHSPVVLSRLWSGAHHGGDWSLRQRIHGRYNFHHNLLNVFDVNKYWATNPEYFPIHNGKRYKPGGSEDNAWQPCLGIEGTVQRAADAAREAFRADPSLESFSLGMNDGSGWCECPACKAIDRPLGSWHGFSGDKSVIFYTWMNKVAANLEKDYPDKKLGCLAYHDVILPPPFKVHRNIIPYFTSNRADYFDPKFKAVDEALITRWSKVATQMGIYDYAYGVGFAIPRIYNHLFQGAVQQAVANKVRGFYAEVYPNWGLDGPKLYTMARIVWDPRVNVDAVTDDWNNRMFREAAQPMKRYFALAEETWRKQKGQGAWAYRLAADPDQFLIFTPQTMETMTGYLDEADRLATDEVVKQRLHFFRKTWKLTQMLAGNYWVGMKVQELVDRQAPVEEVAQAMRDMADKMATFEVDTYFNETFGKDPIAYFPPLNGWFTPLKGGAATNAVRYFASAVASEAVALARKEKNVTGEAIRKHIDARVAAVFGTGGSANYQATVRLMRDMALKIGTASKLDAPVKVDGVLDEAVWQKADVLTNFVNWGATSQAEHVTRVRLAHDGKDLYVALECVGDTSRLKCESADRDGSTWKDDSVEIFVNRNMEAVPFAQFILNARGAFFDQYDRNGKDDYATRLAYDFKSSWASHVYPDKWTGEVRLPLAELGVNPAQMGMIRMNFVRNVNVADQTLISAWFSSLRAHADPLSRGWILFE